MSCGACCIGCGEHQLGDIAVDRVADAMTIREGDAGYRAAILSAVDSLEREARTVRVAHFANDLPLHPIHKLAYALHESAHAVVGMLFGLTVEQVNIDTSVTCSFEPSTSIAHRDASLVLLAGDAPRRRLARIKTREGNVAFAARIATAPAPEHRCDQCQVMRRLAWHQPDLSARDRELAYYKLEDEALSLIMRPGIWRAIDALATVLVGRGHLDSAEVQDVVAPFQLAQQAVELGFADEVIRL